ncbi:NUDIX domain-containing protein [Microbispora sp. NPDC049125]|uniref:NUDIX domain-containing protein n=1 Tax=Microbispora sp. NPDC049125 TaxID=3154929 RepID=UPI00346746AC
MSSGRSAAPWHVGFVASLPRRRVAAGALFRDSAGRVLLVEPTYKPEWDLPGGMVEAGESPTAACRREVLEELGLDRPAGRLLAIDWVPSTAELPDGLMIVYDGGVLTDAEIASIVRQPEEIASVAFVHPDEVGARTPASLARRIAGCLDALGSGEALSLEDGRRPAG